MSIYPPPKQHNGYLNTIFNSTDYNNTYEQKGLSIIQADGRYLKNNGTNNFSQLNVSNLATIKNLNVEKLFKAKKSSDTLTTAIFTSNQVYDFANNGMVYYITSNNTTVNSVSFINIPDLANQSYIFTFIFKLSQADSPYYIKTSTISVNGVSVTLHGLQNISLPSNYTYLVQQITIIYGETDLFALTSVASY